MTNHRRLELPTLLHRARWLGLLLGVLGGCTGTPDLDNSAQDDGLGSEAAAVTTPTWISPECGEAGLTAPAGSCDGPWTYTEHLQCTGQNPACGQVCTQPFTCAQWAFGVDPLPLPSSNGPSGSEWCTESCNIHTDACTTSCGGSVPDCDAPLGLLEAELEATYQAQVNGDASLPAALRQERLQDVADVVQVGAEMTSTSHTTTRQGGKFIVTTDTTTYRCRVFPSGAQPRVSTDAACGCGASIDATCTYECGTAPRATAPGVAMPSNLLYSDVSCSTCEHIDLTDVPAKHDCLSAGLANPSPSLVGSFAYRNAIVARLKLLLELRGNLLLAAQRAAIVALYADEPGAAVCHAPLPVSETCTFAGVAGGLNGRLQLCQNLDREGVPVAVIVAELDYCLGLFGLVAAAEDPMCRDAYAAAVHTTLRGLLARSMDVITLEASALAHLDQALAAIDRWYEHAVLLGGEDRAALRANTSVIVGAFWKRVHDVSQTLPTTVDSSNVGAVLTMLEGKNLAAEYAVLTAAFAAGSTVDTPPLLMIVADALRSTISRLDTVSEMHDLACRYRPCAPTSSTQSTELWRVLASLQDGAHGR